jgi:carboxymethylenebutenolidase
MSKSMALKGALLIAAISASLTNVATVSAQDWAKARLNNSPRHAEWTEIKSGDRTIKAFVVYPERKDKAPVVLVVHEIFGLTDWVRGLCDQLAENGVIGIAPDLLSGQTYADVDGARKAISELPEQQIKADLDATSEYALKIPAGNGTLAVCGFCWGGGWVFQYANMNPKLKAAYSFYGTAADNESKVANIACPVYGFYAGNDERVNATVPTAQDLMRQANKKYDPMTYAGAGHGFMREGEKPDASEENRKARDDAWARWKTLLKQL